MTGPRYKKTADELAKFGRYGDDMLVHMNRHEVAGLASLSPTGKLTVNPETGQPEAFLPFLAPILGSVLGKAFIPAAAGKLGLGSMIGPKMAAAIGSGAARWAETGSLEKGLMSGITGFGLGQAMSGFGDPASQAALEEATAEAVLGQTELTPEMIQEAARTANASPETWGQVFQQGVANVRDIGANLPQIAGAATRPGTMIPVAIGEGQIAEMDRQDMMREQAARARADREAEYDRARSGLMSNLPGYRGPRPDYGLGSLAPLGYAEGGEVAPKKRIPGAPEPEKPPAGVITLDPFPTPAANTPAARQAGIIGLTRQAPGADYRHGFAPEFLFFGPGAPPSTFVPAPMPGGGAPSQPPPGMQPPPPSNPPVPPGQQPPPGMQPPPSVPVVEPEPEPEPEPKPEPEPAPEPEPEPLPIQPPVIVPEDPIVAPMPGDSEGVPVQPAPGMQPPPSKPVVPAPAPAPEPEPEPAPAPAPKPAPSVPQPTPRPPPSSGGGIGDLIGGGGSGPGDNLEWDYEPPPPPETRPPIEDFINPDTYSLPEGAIWNPRYIEEYEAFLAGGPPPASNPYFPGIPGMRFLDGSRTVFFGGRGTMDGRGGMMAAGGLVQRYAEGGEVMATRGVPQQADANTIVQRAAAAIRGELPEAEAEQAVADLIETFGSGAYRQLRETVLQGVVPGAQTEGLIRGSGGGMDDQVMGMIGSQQPVAVSPGEFIIPADVVSGLGDGSTDAGAQRLDELIESVRMARTGTDEQPAPIRESMGGSV